MKSKITIRTAKLKDCQKLAYMINLEAEKGNMLPKTAHEIMLNLSNFFVAEVDGCVVGCCGYKIWINAWIEIISLVIEEKFRGRGLGTKLVDACIKQAKRQGFSKISTLTANHDWFYKRGFREVDIEILPHKIWGDCAKCSRNAAGPGDVRCNEVPMVLMK